MKIFYDYLPTLIILGVVVLFFIAAWLFMWLYEHEPSIARVIEVLLTFYWVFHTNDKTLRIFLIALLCFDILARDDKDETDNENETSEKTA